MCQSVQLLSWPWSLALSAYQEISLVGSFLGGHSRGVAFDVDRASTRVPAVSAAACISRSLPLIEDFKGVICPFILIFSFAWQPTNPLWHIKIVTLEKSICPGICPSPSPAFSNSLKKTEPRAASESTSCNIQQRRRHADLCQGSTFEKSFLLNDSQFVWKP